MYESNSDHENGASGYDSSTSSNHAGNNGSAAAPADQRSKPVPSEPELTCSRCGSTFLRSESKNMPFCSRQCQQIDLGMWLNESYGIPFEGEGSPEQYEDPDEHG